MLIRRGPMRHASSGDHARTDSETVGARLIPSSTRSGAPTPSRQPATVAFGRPAPSCFIPLRKRLSLARVCGSTYGNPKPTSLLTKHCALLCLIESQKLSKCGRSVVRVTRHWTFISCPPDHLTYASRTCSAARFGRRRAYFFRGGGTETNASDGRIRRRRTKPRSPHSRETHTRDARRSLALSTVLLQNGLSTIEQCSRRGRYVQDALLSAYKNLDQFKGQAQMSTWLTTIVMNCARMQLRRRSRQSLLSLDEQFGEESGLCLLDGLANDRPCPEVECQKSELRGHLMQFVEQLSPACARHSSCVTLTG